MAKNKQQKKKEREKRVAQKKLATAEKQAQVKTAKEPQKSTSPLTHVMASAVVPKANYVPLNNKNPFNQRRGSGG